MLISRSIVFTLSAGLVSLGTAAASAAKSRGTAVATESLEIAHEGFNDSANSDALTRVRPVKVPGIHKVPDVTLKRGTIGTAPKTDTAPKPKSSLDALPPAPSAVPGWDPQTKKTITGEAPPTAAIRPPVLDDRKYTDLVDDLIKPAPSRNGLGPKPRIDLPGTGTPFAGKNHVANPTHKLHATPKR